MIPTKHSRRLAAPLVLVLAIGLAGCSVLGGKGIPNRVDDWGATRDHDWPTWHAMLPKYLSELA